MHSLGQLEFHITDRCNLSCSFCAHYSDMHLSNRSETLESAIEQWSQWSSKIKPSQFWILGGEPTLHSDLCLFLVAAKQIWKHSTIGLVTNGIAIKKHYALNQALVGCNLAVSMHGVREDEIKRQVAELGLSETTKVDIRSSSGSWIKYYQIKNGKPQPFQDGNQRMSWESCNSKRCTVLRDNQLWKCPQVAFASSVGIQWFNGYQPCKIDDNIHEWLSREDELCCANCPTMPSPTS